jgi:hypothetical protein
MDPQSAQLDQFIDTLIKEKFTEAPPGPEATIEIKAQLTDRLNQYLTLRTIDAISSMDPTLVTKLHDLIATNPDPTLVNAFIQEHIKEPDTLVAQILSDFRSLYLGIEEKKVN